MEFSKKVIFKQNIVFIVKKMKIKLKRSCLMRFFVLDSISLWGRKHNVVKFYSLMKNRKRHFFKKIVIFALNVTQFCITILYLHL